jgi:hypothetical protein
VHCATHYAVCTSCCPISVACSLLLSSVVCLIALLYVLLPKLLDHAHAPTYTRTRCVRICFCLLFFCCHTCDAFTHTHTHTLARPLPRLRHHARHDAKTSRVRRHAALHTQLLCNSRVIAFLRSLCRLGAVHHVCHAYLRRERGRVCDVGWCCTHASMRIF